MKKIIYVITIFLFCYTQSYADELPKLTGNVGGYDIEMYIDPIDFFTGDFTGKYRYLSQKNYLSIEGKAYDNVFIIKEYYNDKNTGTFYLERTDDTFVGKWYGNSKHFDVELSITSGDESLLAVGTYESYPQLCSDEITGTYKVAFYSLSYALVPDESYPPDLIESGGTAIFEELENGSLRFKIEMIFGPTAHWAGAEGIAFKDQDKYIYISDARFEKCMITFSFENKTVYAKDNGSPNCGFGAWAQIDHTLYKVNDGFEDF